MLKKCLKYDLKAIWPVWRIIAIAVFGVGLFGCVCFRGTIDLNLHMMTHESNLLTALGSMALGLTAGLSVIALIAFLTVTQILVYIRFYRNFFTDEGYLTFTLPVSRKDLYLSKVCSAMIWTVASIALVVVVVLFGMLVIPPVGSGDTAMLGDGLAASGQLDAVVGPFNLIAFKIVGEGLTAIWEDVGGWMIVYALEALALLFGIALFNCGLVHLCVTLGSIIARRHKLLASIGLYFGVTSAVSVTGEILVFFCSIMMVEGLVLILSELSAGMVCLVAALIVLLLCVAAAILNLVMHNIALGNLEKRLNLA